MAKETIFPEVRLATEDDVADIYRYSGKIDGIDQNKPYAIWNCIRNFGFGLVGEVDGQFAGYSLANPTHQSQMDWFVWQLAVREKFQGHGVGRDLVKAVGKEILVRGGNAMTMSIADDNEASLATFGGYAELVGVEMQQLRKVELPVEGEKTETIYRIPMYNLFH